MLSKQQAEENAAKYQESRPISFGIAALDYDLSKPDCTKRFDGWDKKDRARLVYSHNKDGLPIGKLCAWVGITTSYYNVLKPKYQSSWDDYEAEVKDDNIEFMLKNAMDYYFTNEMWDKEYPGANRKDYKYDHKIK